MPQRGRDSILRPWCRLMYDLRTFGDSSAAGKHAAGTAEMGEMLLSRQKDGAEDGSCGKLVDFWPFFLEINGSVFGWKQKTWGVQDQTWGVHKQNWDFTIFHQQKWGLPEEKRWGLPAGKIGKRSPSGADLTRPACSMGSQARSSNCVTTNTKSLNHWRKPKYDIVYPLVI